MRDDDGDDAAENADILIEAMIFSRKRATRPSMRGRANDRYVRCNSNNNMC
jgi:hypothetical protein